MLSGLKREYNKKRVVVFSGSGSQIILQRAAPTILLAQAGKKRQKAVGLFRKKAVAFSGSGSRLFSVDLRAFVSYGNFPENCDADFHRKKLCPGASVAKKHFRKNFLIEIQRLRQIIKRLFSFNQTFV
jgi:hypothetical protein